MPAPSAEGASVRCTFVSSNIVQILKYYEVLQALMTLHGYAKEFASQSPQPREPPKFINVALGNPSLLRMTRSREVCANLKLPYSTHP